MTAAKLAIASWPVEKVTPYARNPRHISDIAVAKVAGSLAQFGWRQPIVVDSEGVIVAGHTRWLAAQRLGLTHVPVHVATDLSPSDIKAYRLADNRTGEEAKWDEALLGLEIADLQEFGIDLAITGFDASELKPLIGGEDDATPPDGFGEYAEDIETEHVCPKCGYRWSGGDEPMRAAADDAA